MNAPVNLQSSPAASSCWLPCGASAGGASLSSLSSLSGRTPTAMSMVQSSSTEVSVETAEGDKVTLSFSSRTEATYQSYNAQGALEGAADARLETFTLSSGSEMSIAVEGDLSDAERADIEKVMSAVQAMAREFFEGDVDKALAEGLSVDDVQTIAGLQVNMEISRSFSVSFGDGAAQTALQDPSVVVDPNAPAAAQSQPAAAGPNAQTAVQSQPAAPGAQTAAQDTAAVPDPNAQAGSITLDKLRDFVSSMTASIAGAGVDPSKAGKHMLKILEHILDEMAGEDGFDSDKHKVAELVKSEVADKLDAMAGSEAHEADGEGHGQSGGVEKAGHDHDHGNDHGHRHGH